MKLLRRIALLCATSLLRLTLFFGISLLAILYMFGKPNHLESTLQQANAYSQLVPAVTQSLAAASNSNDGIPFNDPNVQKIVSESFPPKTIQNSAETTFNGIYNWLEGKTPQPVFRVDFTSNRDLVTNNLTAYAFNRLAAQPLCSTQPETVNPFTANCLPRNYSITEERTAFAAEINALFPKTVFTANDLPRFSNGKSISDFPEAPHLYRVLQFTPWILLALVVVLSLGTLLLSPNARRGVRLLSSVLLSSGIALVIAPLLYLLVYPHINHALSLQSTNTGINSLVSSVIGSLSRDFNDFILKGALVTINLGLLLFFVERFTRAKSYGELAKRSGLVSGVAQPAAKSSTALVPDMVPLQSSEQPAKTHKTKRSYGINHKPSDGAD